MSAGDWIKFGQLVVSVISLCFGIYQWRKRVRMSENLSAFLHGLKAAAEVANVQPIVVQINDRLAKLNPPKSK